MNQKPYLLFFVPIGLAFIILGNFINVGASSASDQPYFVTTAASAGFIINPTSGLTTTEAGGSATFSVVLTGQPGSNVSINLTSSDLTEGTITPVSLQFTKGNWNNAHIVTITGVDDALVDGNIAYTINGSVASSDTNYANLPFPAVSVTNNDNDVASIKTTANSGLTTNENGAQATFTMVLGSQPIADVTISLASSKPAEGTVSPSSLVFNGSNWNALRTVTVTGIDDLVVDGSVAYTINGTSSSTDPNYDNKLVNSVSLVNLDNDTAGFTISPGGGLVTTETGGAATFLVKLTSHPVADVVVTFTNFDPSEGIVSPSALTYTAANWNDFQTVTVTGVDDLVADGNITYTINGQVSSTDGNYNALLFPGVSVSNTDNDVAGFSITPSSALTTTSPLTTTETGMTATFRVALTSQPITDVTINLSSSNTNEGNVSPSVVTFTSANWNDYQTVTVTGLDDSIADGNIDYMINGLVANYSDAKYVGLTFPSVKLKNYDNDIAGIKLTLPSDLTTNENGKKVNFTVALTSQPSADVTVKLTSTANTEGTVSPISLTFTSANWITGQTVTITGVDDEVADGNIPYNINITATSTDPDFKNLAAQEIKLINMDNDSPGFDVNPTSGLVTSESGGKARFFVALTSQPTADVTIQWTSSITTEGIVSPAATLFNSTNWSIPITVTVTGVDDFVIDGNIPYSITGHSTSVDLKYQNKTLPDISLINSDNDAAGITVNRTSGLYTTEAGRIISFTVALNTQPSAIVTITMTSTNSLEGVVSPTLLTFSKTDWNQAKVVTLTGIDDQVNDGNINYSILMALTSSDQKYNKLPAPFVLATNLDNDGPTIAWAAPIDTNVTNDLIYTFSSSQQPSLQLTISDQHNEPISKVRFYRWDFVLNQHVEIGIVSAPPFTLYLDTTTLYLGYNQIFAVAYDPEGNQSNHIWLFADRRELVFLPTIKR